MADAGPLGRAIYYMPQVKAASSGGLWNVDFESSYAPLFPYLGAALIQLWDNPAVFVLFASCVDIVALWCWQTTLKGHLPRQDVLDLSTCYALSAPIVANVLVGQQQAWIGAGLAISTWLLLAGRAPLLSAAVQGATLCMTKILAVMFWPVLFAASSTRMRWALVAGLFPLLTVVAFWWLGSDLLLGLQYEQMQLTSGNLVYYADYVVGSGRQYFFAYDIVTAICLLSAATLVMTRLSQDDGAERVYVAIALMLVTLLLLSKKSYANYLGIAFYPLLFVLYRNLSARWYWLVFVLLSMAATAAPNLWFARGGNGKSLRTWVAKLGWEAAWPTVACDMVLLSTYAIVAWLCLKALAGRRAARAQP